ncbi:hypothetical protein V6N13_120202 [Hibiscus sabdariffa]
MASSTLFLRLYDIQTSIDGTLIPNFQQTDSLVELDSKCGKFSVSGTWATLLGCKCLPAFGGIYSVCLSKKKNCISGKGTDPLWLMETSDMDWFDHWTKMKSVTFII